uniref:NADH-ubiquinone oxidoreductase chain 2 n=1 Tax=Pristurus carteri TaxID=401534 RepID=D3XB22_9SAUR|nr:NADH dehydrogenase subunit 2 [Pristurus carteri]
MTPALYGLFLLGLLSGTLITMSSTHWLLAWIGLELNTLAMLPLISRYYHPRATEATLKYFLVQTTASTIILFTATLNAWYTGQWTISHPAPTLTTIALTASIMFKLGIAPLHLWYPEVLQGAPMTAALIIATWQKLAPLSLAYMTLHLVSTNFLVIVGVTTIAIGAMTGLIHTQTRKVMAYSSIGHMGWLLIALLLSPKIATLTVMVYITTTTAAFLVLTNTRSNTITTMGTSWPQGPTCLLMMALNLLSLAGLPPLLGFAPKLLIIEDLTHNGLAPLATTMILLGLPALYYYVRLAYFTLLTMPPMTHPMRVMKINRFPPSSPLMTTAALLLATMPLPLIAILYEIV